MILGNKISDKSRYGNRARKRMAREAVDLQCNNFDCFIMVVNRDTKATWIQCSERLWDEYKGERVSEREREIAL